MPTHNRQDGVTHPAKPLKEVTASTGRTISIQIDAAQIIIAAPYNPKRTHAPFSLRLVTM